MVNYGLSLVLIASASLCIYAMIILKAIAQREVLEMDISSGLSLFCGFISTAYCWFMAGKYFRQGD